MTNESLDGHGIDTKRLCRYIWQPKRESIQDKLVQLLSQSRLTDCTFKVGTHEVKTISGHKLMLAVRSPVFEALFYGPMASSGNQVITIPDIEPSTFTEFLQYLYSDSVAIDSCEKALRMLYASKKYLVDSLSDLCVSYLSTNVTISTLWDVLHVAEAFNIQSLILSCIKIMAGFPYEFWSKEDTNMSLETLNKLLSVQNTCLSEHELWEIVLDWTSKELESRGISDTPMARRELIDSANFTSKIRFLTIPYELLKQSEEIFTSDEVSRLRAQENLPKGFNSEMKARFHMKPMTWVNDRTMYRDEIKYRQTGNFEEGICKLSSTSKILVFGFDVYSRFFDQMPVLPELFVYTEKFSICISDPSENILSKFEFNGSVKFNNRIYVELPKPVWFEACRNYTIRVKFSGGDYPIYCYTNVSATTSYLTSMVYTDVVTLSSGDKLTSAFICAVKYAL